MKAFCFFSVHEELFHRMVVGLQERGVTEWSGFVWGQHQADALANRGVAYDLTIFTRDFLPAANDGQPPDLVWLAKREKELGVSIQRMLAAERHLLEGRTYEQIMRLAEVALRKIAEVYDRVKPDFVMADDISCFHSYAHFAVSRELKIPHWCITSGRMPNRVAVYSRGTNNWDRLQDLYPKLLAQGLTIEQRREAEAFLHAFREKPLRPTGMGARAKKPKLELSDVGRFTEVVKRFRGDPDDPTLLKPVEVVRNRLRRIARVASTELLSVFESPVEGEKYVFYPLHFQPEASTLVQGPLYVDQLSLLRDIAASLPVGYRLYVKEHVSSRGRRSLDFYEQVHAIPSARLFSPDEDTWSLIRNSSAVVVITGTPGWEGLLFGKPVITFGDVFFNLVPSVLRAGQAAKDDWFQIFDRALHHHTPDPEEVLVLISALQQCGMPGFIGNPRTFPEAISPENIGNLVAAVAREVGC